MLLRRRFPVKWIEEHTAGQNRPAVRKDHPIRAAGNKAGRNKTG